MIWVDREVKKIISLHNKKSELVDDMKTPSGRIHVGSLRGVIIHDLIYKVLLENGVNAKFSYVFNDLDQMDAVPSYLNYEKWEKYAGMPLCNIPAPEKNYKSFAEYYAKEFTEVFESINCHPQIIWSSKLYRSGKMNPVIEEVLNQAKKVREIYARVAKAEKPEDWYPFQVICQKCGKIGTTQVYKWDGKLVHYRCEPKMAAWAMGCGHQGVISPFDGNGKFHWKVDWPAHWKVIGVTIEGAGKDHMSSGGSYDMAQAICEEILNYPPTYPPAYEWFTIGGKKMSSSKGIGTSAKEVSRILPPDVFRFLIVRTPIGTHLDFNPYGVTILNLFDDYDRCLNAYFSKIEKKLPEGKPGEVLEEFARIVELSAVKPLPEKRLYLPRFRTVTNLVKTKTDLLSFFEKQKGSKLTQDEKEILEERIVYAQVYLKNYSQEAGPTSQASEKKSSNKLNSAQKLFLKSLADKLDIKNSDRETLQKTVYASLASSKIPPKEAFKAFYQSLTADDFGPKAADLILELGVNVTKEKLLNSVKQKGGPVSQTKKTNFPDLNDEKIFSIAKTLAEKFPSINIGIAIIKNVTINKISLDLQKEIAAFIKTQSGLTNEMLGSFREIQSYRRMYREMKVDWHSRRPSPEALLRRIALKKGLYEINSCVDAYNLVVMKNRISSGAFDLDKIKLPTILRFPKREEKILLLGDNEPTEYKPEEVAYFDQIGGYNIDFNYRDAQRTAVTEKTKNLLINIDGVYEINRTMVEETLKQTLEKITKYCGGTVEVAGIVSAK